MVLLNRPIHHDKLGRAWHFVRLCSGDMGLDPVCKQVLLVQARKTGSTSVTGSGQGIRPQIWHFESFGGMNLGRMLFDGPAVE